MANIFDLFQKIAKQEPSTSGPVEYIVAGLGNPGGQYEKTRHNAGFLALDYLAEKYGARIDRAKFKALVGEAAIAGKRVLLMKPQTFMNASGDSIAEAARFYKCPIEKIVIISDDFMLDVGRLRVRRKGSHGGHNGLKSIEHQLASAEYPRIRIGVGQKPHPDYDVIDWVLGSFSAEDLQQISSRYDTLSSGLEKILLGDIDGAMQICNGK
ncbi:MAG: aminoacyl-tRNA hydrolase [Clostridia bacterium]|nr:aminoacyl-tRNA hydrolase [Clostridia bacterium]